MTDIVSIEREARIEIARLSEYEKLTVTDQESYEIAGKKALEVNQILKNISEKFKEPVEAAYQAHKKIKGLQNEIEAPFKRVIDAIRGKTNLWLTEQDRKRREEERKAKAEAEKKEAEEKAKLEKKADRAEAKGNEEKAEELRKQAERVVVVPDLPAAVETNVRSSAGSVSSKSDISVEIIDRVEFLKAVIEGGRWDFIEIKIAAVKRFVQGAKLEKFPGCEVKEIQKAVFRG